ncbi:MAG: hypothetical protein JWS10_634 [Cypionkella sp.]|uniref:hypothetical protein n=1 Tax=Cypionkella sp. TaxID=2811411 RepID=UPI002619357F|nr:hypothetical protein [Cypionkella sp.]MDB5658019.1 hypothetical protein [Cypionkella sp.]
MTETEKLKRPTRLAVSLVQIARALRIQSTTLSVALSVIDTDQMRPIKYQDRPGVAVRTLYLLESVHRLLSMVASNRYTVAAGAELRAVATEIEMR